MQLLRRRDETNRHVDALRDSTRLTQTFYRMYRPGQSMITPEEMIAALNQAGVEFVLMGTHGIGGWRSEPRATDDVDFLIKAEDHRKAISAIRRAFPRLKKRDLKVVTRFRDPDTKRVVVDLMRPCEPFYQKVFQHSISAGRTHRIPGLEMALVAKFAAMVSTTRSDKKKLVDANDFMDIVETQDEIIDVKKLRRLAELVYAGGGQRIKEFLEDARAGRMPNFRR